MYVLTKYALQTIKSIDIMFIFLTKKLRDDTEQQV